MNVLIVGDSWGLGEWNLLCTDISHRGLEQYLIDDGHSVTNLSKGGISNIDIYHRLRNYLDRSQDCNFSKIVVFQTEYTRDFRYEQMNMHHVFGVDDWKNLLTPSDLSSRWIERFYLRLSEVSQEYKIPVLILGGCSDTIPFDNMDKDYPGCSIACQSITNLLVNQDPFISKPVFSWYLKNSEDLVRKLKKSMPMEGLSVLLDDIHRGFERQCTLQENPDLFYPDGRHPNRRGHFLLYEYLKQNNFI